MTGEATTDTPVDEAAEGTGAEAQTTEATSTDQQADPKTEEAPKEGEEGKPKEGEAEEQTGAPEEYADFSAPEGVELDEASLGDFKTLAKELNLPQDAAQKVVDIGAKMAQSWAEQANAQSETMVAEWRTAAEADPRFGGEKLGENLAIAKKAMDTFASPELRSEVLEKFGLGNHPEVINLFFELGKKISEDGFVSATQSATGGERVIGSRFYDASDTK